MCKGHFVNSAKYCQLENELMCGEYTSKVDEKQFLNVQKGASSESPRSKLVCGTDSLTILHSSEFTYTKCITEPVMVIGDSLTSVCG